MVLGKFDVKGIGKVKHLAKIEQSQHSMWATEHTAGHYAQNNIMRWDSEVSHYGISLLYCTMM